MSKKESILKYDHEEKSKKVQFIIYGDMESLLNNKTYTCHNNPKNLSTTKKNKHNSSGCSLFTHCSFDVTKSKHEYYRGKDCIKNFCKDLREHSTKIISHEKKK